MKERWGREELNRIIADRINEVKECLEHNDFDTAYRHIALLKLITRRKIKWK